MIINTVEIDGKYYDYVDIITIGDVKYAYLVDSNDDGNLLIQKIVLKDNEEYYEPLKSKDEYDNALIEFYHKHKDLIDKAN